MKNGIIIFIVIALIGFAVWKFTQKEETAAEKEKNSKKNIVDLLQVVTVEKKKEDGKIRFRMVATDGHRLSLVEREISGKFQETAIPNAGVIIPRKGLSEIKKKHK